VIVGYEDDITCDDEILKNQYRSQKIEWWLLITTTLFFVGSDSKAVLPVFPPSTPSPFSHLGRRGARQGKGGRLKPSPCMGEGGELDNLAKRLLC
jgi:hypothetical protein